MALIKKLFGGIDLTWPKLIISAVVIGILTGVIAMCRPLIDTSFHNITVYFEFWILAGILIIVNSKSPLDSALKCFVFFLVSQPLVYLVQVPFSDMGFGILSYYRNWIVWTILTFPMGYIGWYMKKDQWWSVFILVPMLGMLALEMTGYIGRTVFWFPRNLLSVLFCLFTMFGSVLGIFNDKKAKMIGLAFASVFAIAAFAIAFMRPVVYDTQILFSGGSSGVTFDETYQASFEDPKMGDIAVEYEEGVEDYVVHVKLRHGGRNRIYLDGPDGSRKTFDISVRYSTYEVNEVK